MKTILFALVLAGCIDDEMAVATDVEELNGETWTTVDDNPYTDGGGATYIGVAISPTTHKIFAVGSRFETNGTTTAIVRGCPVGCTAFALNSVFKYLATGSSQATAITVDAQGRFYVLGTAFDAAGTKHFIVRRTDDDGATWKILYTPAVGANDSASGISVDAAGYVYVAASMFANNTNFKTVLQSPSQGAGPWTSSYSAGVLNLSNGLQGVCQALYNGQPATFAVGWTGSPGSSATATIYSTNHGATWSSTSFSFAPVLATRAFGCSADRTGMLDIATGNANTTQSVWDGSTWNPATGALLNDDQIASTTMAGNSTYATTTANGYEYFVGSLHLSTGDAWSVRRYTTAGGITSHVLVDQYTPTLSPGTAYARGVANDPTRGLYVVGYEVVSGRLHGIIRHKS